MCHINTTITSVICFNMVCTNIYNDINYTIRNNLHLYTYQMYDTLYKKKKEIKVNIIDQCHLYLYEHIL